MTETGIILILLSASWGVLLAVIGLLAWLLRLAHLRITELAGILCPKRPSSFFYPVDKPTGRSGNRSIADEVERMHKDGEQQRRKSEREGLTRGEAQEIMHGLGMTGVGGDSDARTV